MYQALDIQQFLTKAKERSATILDVRSPSEFNHGHIPGAKNLVLFDDIDRAEIGTLYKQKGRQTAVIRGLEIVAPKLSQLVLNAKDQALENEIYIHCWRGGMRSGFVATLLDMYGIKVFTLKGGYKKFRNFVLQDFQAPRTFYILSGKTGSGKTYILKKLGEAGRQVIDLEGIAHHKGSAFGALGQLPQPTQEQFENELHMLLRNCCSDQPIWLEDESRNIGKNMIPPPFFIQMRAAKVFCLDLPYEERLQHIVNDYGKFTKEEIIAILTKISKRIGPEQTKNAIAASEQGDFKTAFSYCLNYYDKTYTYGLSQRDKGTIERFEIPKFDINACVQTILSATK